MDLNTQLEQLRKQVQETSLSNEKEVVQLNKDFLSCLVDLAEFHQQEHSNEWENGPLVKEYMQHALPLGFVDTDFDFLYTTARRLADLLTEHPRLKVLLLRFELRMLKQTGKAEEEMNALTQTINQEINFLERNIRWADAGNFDKIGANDFFKTDPVEWTEQWESCIDEVYEKVEEKLGEPGFVMGISLQYWKIKAEILKEFGIVWRSPAQMNPDMIFD